MTRRTSYVELRLGAGPRSARQNGGRVLTPTHDVAAPAADSADGLPFDRTPDRPDTGRLESDRLLAHILASLEDDKAEEIVRIDLRGKTEMADWMVVASGRSTRQVTAIAQKLTDRLKQDHGRSSRVEGKEAGDWVLIDAGDVIVHVFRPEVRDFYQLEKMWQSPAGTAPANA